MTTPGFGGEGPVFVPAYDPELVAAQSDDERTENAPIDEATPEEIAEEEAVVEHLDDPEVEEAIERLRESRE